jgi:hypothetical protein
MKEANRRSTLLPWHLRMGTRIKCGCAAAGVDNGKTLTTHLA